MKNKHTPYATLLIVFTIIYAAAFYMLSAQTQFYIYDYCYVFRHAPDHLKHIPGYEAFSFYTDHFAGVSRFVPHLLVWAAHHIGKGLFAVAATASFLLLAVLIVRAGCPVRGRLLPLSVLSAALMWFVMPGFFEGFLWMSGACNYLFPAVLTIAFYILFSRDSHNTISSYDYIFLPLLWLFGFIAGWTNEGFVVGMAAGCILFFIVRRDLITRRRIALLCGYICGAIPLCLSPLNTARLFDSHKDCTGLYDHIHAFAVSVYSMTNAPLSITLAILAVAAVAATGRHRALGAMRRFAAKHIIILTAWLVSALFIIITRYTSDYSRIPTELYATVLLIAAASRLNARTLGALSLPAAIVLTIAAMYTLPADAGNARTYACLRGSIARGERVICCRPYSLNRFERRYIVPLSQCSFNHTIIGPSKDIILKYYNADPTTEIVPCELIGHRGQALEPDHIMHLPLWGMYFIKLRPEADVRAVSFILTPATKDRGIAFRPLRRNIDASEMPAQKYTVITLPDGTRWLGVHENSAISSRVSNIRITCRFKHEDATF